MFDQRGVPIRKPSRRERGKPFADFLATRLSDIGKDPREARRHAAQVAALVHEWAKLCDDLGREPTIVEYAVTYSIPEATARRDIALFREVFPSEATPTRVVKVLWDASESWGDVLAAEVVGR